MGCSIMIVYSGQQLLEGQGDQTGSAISDHAEVNEGAVRSPHQAAEFGLANGYRGSTVNLRDDIADADARRGRGRIRQDGDHTEARTIDLDGLESGFPLDRLNAEGGGTLEPEALVRVVERNHELSQNLVADTTININNRKSVLSSGGKLNHGTFDFGIGNGETVETRSNGLEYFIDPTDLHTRPAGMAGLEAILVNEPAL